MMKKESFQTLFANLTASCLDVKCGRTGNALEWMSRPWPVFTFLHEGEMETLLGGNNPERLIRREGSIIYYPAGIPRLQKMRIPGSYTAIMPRYETASGENVLNFFRIPVLFYSKILTKHLLNIATLHTSGNPADLLKERALILLFLYELLKISPEKESVPDSLVRTRLTPVLEYIQTHRREEIRITRLAEQTGLSRQQFYAVFRRETGLSPRDYIMRKRLHEIELLLTTTDLTLGEIAEKTGWSDPFQLSRRFRSLYGIPPGEYRRKVRCSILS